MYESSQVSTNKGQIMARTNTLAGLGTMIHQINCGPVNHNQDTGYVSKDVVQAGREGYMCGTDASWHNFPLGARAHGQGQGAGSS